MSAAKRTAETTQELRAALLEHAQRLVSRDGASALTMRALSAEAGVSLGLPYKIFADRREIVDEIVAAEMRRFGAAAESLLTRAGSYTVGDNLIWFASIVLNSPAAPLAQELHAGDQRLESAAKVAERTGLSPTSFPALLADYLTAEQRAGRVRDNIDCQAFGFLIAGALHNLLIAGPAWPRPERGQLKRYLTAAARAIAKEPQGG
ncbi:MAG TPA: TetR/AcrR family transcriptional regulator [Propionibacteriaceae bacterium]|nr:TetR/AcrR family transcriptional regulator [Propionibacteriaceae bacterium]